MSKRAQLAGLVLAVCLPFASAHALTMGTWNVAELDASDDVVDLQFGTSGSRTTLTLQWLGGSADTPGALGIDKFFINNASTSLSVVNVFIDAISAASSPAALRTPISTASRRRSTASSRKPS